jgi:2-polyprenyl-3-methyl-5-hydroxy-6-metoxy-1,4-benzoquinol methylase
MIETIKKIRRKIIDNTKPLPKYYKIASMLEENKKVLDFGCWQGDLSKILIEKKNSKVTGCDLIVKPKFKDKNFKYIKVSAKKQNFPLKQTFDYVVFADVLEHLKTPKKMMEGTFRHTEKCIISVPNCNFFLYKTFPKLEEPPVELTPHLHHWTLKKFKEVLPKNTEIKKVKYCTDFPEFRIFNYIFPNISLFNQTLIMEIVKND